MNTDVDGSTLVVHSRLSLNLAGGTLEQVLSRRRRMLMDMVDGFELEVRDALTPKDDGGATQKQVQINYYELVLGLGFRVRVE